MKALYPGSFDPITKGHIDIIERACKMYEEVVVAIMTNPKKQATFSQEKRKEWIEKSTAHLKNVKIIVGSGLTIDLAKRLNIHVLIRGIRAVADYEYELQQATTNMMLDHEIETVFLVAKPEFSFLSSSVAKEVASYQGDIRNMIPEEIIDEVLLKFSKNP
ncbi:MAG: pantetheine-phosphate adenylyltransferase [Erysipelotrichaceae bacterium]|nr:pantetheine-phosphate adenylyltransferase [Erysipelotrichaceae bacterium]